MAVDVEDQVRQYAEWLEERTGASMCRPDGDEPIEMRPSDSRRPPWLHTSLVVAAAALIVVTGLVALRSRDGDPPAAGAGGVESIAAWYEIDPARSFGAFDEVPENEPRWLLACRAPGPAGNPCTSLVGTRSVTYRTPHGEHVYVSTEHGPDVSVAWDMLRQEGEQITVDGYRGYRGGNNYASATVGFEPAADVRVITTTQSSEPPVDVTRESIVALANSLVATSATENLPVIFGESRASRAQIPRDGSGPSYYAGYVDLTGSAPCVGGFNMPWNWGPTCVVVPDDEITITVASPSPTGTILIAALPASTARAEVAIEGGAGTRELPVAEVPGFAPRLVFADLDGAIPVELTAYAADGSKLDSAPITSTGGAALGYLPSDEETAG